MVEFDVEDYFLSICLITLAVVDQLPPLKDVA
jgi:hypothetical protein